MFTYTCILSCISALLIQNSSGYCVGKRQTISPEVNILSPTFEPSYDNEYNTYYPDDSYYPEPSNDCPEECEPEYYDGCLGTIIIEEPVADCCCEQEIPLITAIGFGGDAVSMALSPLLEAADADVALLMFTKVKVI